LKLEESAVPVGPLKGPIRWETQRALLRRNTVIEQMVKYGFIQPADAQNQQKLKDSAAPAKRRKPEYGIAPYFERS